MMTSINNYNMANAWDAEYRTGRYVKAPHLAFAEEIVSEVKKKRSIFNSHGLYVGCGNGRNYVWLSKAGLDIIGLDVSEVGLKQISVREPWLAGKLVHGNFTDYDGRFGYIISIQSFQHGNKSVTDDYFHRAAGMLEHNGLLFVRVNASDTDVLYNHSIVEKTNGGFTVLYNDGPKTGLQIHFFSKDELEEVVRDSGLRMLQPPKKVVIERTKKRGSWSQWEMVATLEVPP